MKGYKYIVLLLFLTGVSIWISTLSFSDRNLHLIACDVGRGGAVLATYGETQVLVDGGLNRIVLDCLSHNMPFWDEVVVLTHPQYDA